MSNRNRSHCNTGSIVSNDVTHSYIQCFGRRYNANIENTMTDVNTRLVYLYAIIKCKSEEFADVMIKAQTEFAMEQPSTICSYTESQIGTAPLKLAR